MNFRPRIPRRGGRAVDRAGLENRKAERPREFESHPLRFTKDALVPARAPDLGLLIDIAKATIA